MHKITRESRERAVGATKAPASLGSAATLAFIVVLSTAPGAPGRPSRVTPAREGAAGPSIEEIKRLERDCFDEVNKCRKAHGAAALEYDVELLTVARQYSRRMADEHFFSHTDAEGKSVRERLARAGIRWRSVGENIASSKGYVNPVAVAMHGWLGSPGHRRNILNSGFRLAAVGAWISRDGTVFFTQVFISK